MEEDIEYPFKGPSVTIEKETREVHIAKCPMCDAEFVGLDIGNAFRRAMDHVAEKNHFLDKRIHESE